MEFLYIAIAFGIFTLAMYYFVSRYVAGANKDLQERVKKIEDHLNLK